ncbi:MAG: aldose 1-epimerase family protein [Chakrabartia sp.]
MVETAQITSSTLTAIIAHHGAELRSLTDSDGRELMGPGDAAYWRGRAPLLFPIVGQLNQGTLRLDGKSYTMRKHGFARKSDFVLIEQGADTVLFRLTDSPETRSQYPFAFELDAHFQLADAALHMTVTVRNTGDVPLPASFGYHPAFAWPLPFGGARADHKIIFDQDEPAPIWPLTPAGLIGPEAIDTPVHQNRLTLTDALFADDALVWKNLSSRRLTYGAPGLPKLDIAFPDTEWLGIWTKPGAAFVCVEPWAGMADPDGYSGDFRDKPAVFSLSPGASRSFRMIVTLTP